MIIQSHHLIDDTMNQPFSSSISTILFCWETFCSEPPSTKASCFFGIYFDFSPIANLCRQGHKPQQLCLSSRRNHGQYVPAQCGVLVLHSNANLTKPPPQKTDFVPNPVWSWRSVQLPLSGAGCFFAFAKLIIITIISFVVSFFFFDIKNWLCQHTYTLISSFIALALPIWQ